MGRSGWPSSDLPTEGRSPCSFRPPELPCLCSVALAHIKRLPPPPESTLHSRGPLWAQISCYESVAMHAFGSRGCGFRASWSLSSTPLKSAQLALQPLSLSALLGRETAVRVLLYLGLPKRYTPTLRLPTRHKKVPGDRSSYIRYNCLIRGKLLKFQQQPQWKPVCRSHYKSL